MGYEGLYPPTEKKFLHPYWRYLAHIVTQCLSRRKGGYDVLNQTLCSCMAAIVLGLDFNYSRMIFRDITLPLKRMREDIFSYMTMNKKGNNLFIGARPLEKFGILFSGLDEDVGNQGSLVAFVAKEHDHAPAAATAEATEAAQPTSSESSLGEEELAKEPGQVTPPR
ncbi:hypothetical protein R6Q57_022776 [Mikania cordata]